MFNTMTINRHKPLQSPDHVQFANGSQGGMKHVCRCLCSGIVVGFQQPTEATEVCCGETPRFSPGKTYGKYGASACGLIWNHLDWDYGMGYYSIVMGSSFFLNVLVLHLAQLLGILHLQISVVLQAPGRFCRAELNSNGNRLTHPLHGIYHGIVPWQIFECW